MFDQYLQDNPQLRYPLSDQRIFAKNNRAVFSTESQKLPKSMILDCARREAEAGENLLYKCVEMVESHGFTFENGKCKLWGKEPSFEEAKDSLWYYAPNPRLRQLLSYKHIRERLLNDDVYLEYLTYKHAPILHKYIQMAEEYGLAALHKIAEREGLSPWVAFNKVFYHKMYQNDGRTIEDTKLFQGSTVANILSNKGFFEFNENHRKKTHLCCADDVIKLMGEVSDIQNSLNVQYKNLMLGEQGEEDVAEYLRRFEGESIICKNVLLNSRIKIQSQTSESDICIITNRGIIVCEVKNKFSEGTKDIKISKTGRWEEISKRTGRSVVPEQSPISQNINHCLSIQQLLKENGFSFVRVIPVVIIANNVVDIENESQYHVICKEGIYNIIHDDSLPPCLSSEQMNQLAELLQSDDVEERWFPIETISKISDNIMNTLKQYLDEYEQERVWDNAVTQFVITHVQIIAEEQTQKMQTEHRRDNGFTTIVFWLVAIGILIWVLRLFVFHI